MSDTRRLHRDRRARLHLFVPVLPPTQSTHPLTASTLTAGYSADGHIPEDNPLRASFDMIVDAMSQIGRTFPQPGVLKERLEQAGFVDVTEVCYKQPLGPWPKDKKYV